MTLPNCRHAQVRGQRLDLNHIREKLARCHGVADVVVAMRRRWSDHRQEPEEVLTAYVVPAIDGHFVDDALKRRWERIFNDLAAASDKDRTFDTTGWISSYTGAPLADEDMMEWVDTTAQLMLENNPSTVLDIGCGTGMPLFRVAPHCSHYVGIDSSERTIANLCAAVRKAQLDHVQLRVGVATDVETFAGEGFDLIACNSVTQYLPGLDYLDRVLQGALNAVGDGGRVIFGDVRDLSMQTELHSAVVRAQADVGTSHEQLVAQLHRRISEDRELVIDPRWFAQAVRRDHTIVEIRPRRGRRHNEMTAFRFDVVIHCGAMLEPVEIDRWYDWTGDGMDLNSLRRILASRPNRIGLRAVPNARTQHAIDAVAEILLDNTPYPTELGWPTRQNQPRVGVEPEAFFALATQVGYQCHLSRLAARPGGAYDVALMRRDERVASTTRQQIPIFGAADIGHAPANHLLASEPRRHQLLVTARTSVVPALRRHAVEHLSAHERPDAYVVVPVLPVTANGKINLEALPSPGITRP